VKASTHIGCAELAYLVLLTTAGVRLGPLNAAAVAVSSLLPDIDSGSSRIGGVVPVLTRYIERKVGHRTLTHSLPFMAFLSLLLLVPLLEGYDVAACIIAGYASHPLLDTCTPNGVRLFYPFSGVRCVFPFDGNSPHRFRVDTGSKLDRAIGILFFAACIPALYVAGQGYERFIRVSQHSIESAVRDYDLFARSAAVTADIEGYDQLSGAPLRGGFVSSARSILTRLSLWAPTGGSTPWEGSSNRISSRRTSSVSAAAPCGRRSERWKCEARPSVPCSPRKTLPPKSTSSAKS
jgi:membrane-bound metal-dependent hydrolase YbcI (DUF457 family)